ncbi:MAG: autotransporter-associated beta strand repeat-containing protein [Pirellulales bacterium]|nr:autotransporter-associated beta strand repeat-containing protein [Pirellulales bacterium]
MSAGTLDFSGAPSMPGGNYVVQAGTLDIGALTPTVGTVQVLSGTVSGTGAITATGDYEIESGTINVVLAGGPSVGLNKTTTATAILNANNTYGGTTTISGGTLQLGSAGTTGSVAGPTSIGATGTLVVNRSDAVALSNLSGTGTLSKIAANTATVTNSTFAGNLSFTAGTLDYSSATNTLPAGSYVVSGTELNIGALSQTIATLQLTGGAVINGTGTLTVNGNQFDVQNGTINATLAGSGVLEKASTGTVILNGANSYSGQTSVYAGILQADDGVGLPSGSALRLIGGVLQSNGIASFTRAIGTTQLTNGGFAAGPGTLTVNFGGAGATIPFGLNIGSNINGTLNFGSASSQNVVTFQNGLDIAGATRTISVTDNTATDADYAVISGIISNSDTLLTDVGITKTGANTLALTGANSFIGPTTITTGALRALDTVGLPTGSKLSLNGGVLESVGNDSFTRSIGSWGGAFEWTTNGGGFSAGGGTMTVNVNSGAALEWGTTVGNNLVGILKFGSVTARNVTTLQNAINLNGHQTIQADDNVYTDADYATISGIIADGTTVPSNLTKTGAGTLALTGANAYTGNTIISAGALRATSGTGLPTASLLSLNGGVLESIGNTTVTRTCGTAAGNVQWTTNGGGFSAGTGTMTVNLGSGASLTWGTASAANTIVGTLKFGSATAANVTTFQNNVNLANGSRTIQVEDNTFKAGDYAIMSGVISSTAAASGSMTKTGTGMLILTGTNTYTGATTISAGTLQLGNAGTTGIVGGNIAINGTSALIVNRSNDLTLSGVISGATTATFTKLLANKLTLTGASTYTGLTTVSAGTLEIGSGGTTGSYAGNITDNAAVSFNRSNASSYAAVISGPGTVSKLGAGTLTATGANAYLGDTIISGGALQADDGVGLPTASFLKLDGGVLQSNSAATFTRGLAASGASNFQWTANGGGFSAGAGNMDVNVGGALAPLTWGATVGTEVVGTLKLSSTTALNVTTMLNAIDLNGADRTVLVDDNAGATTDKAVLAGVLSNGTGTAGLVKTGAGRLELTAVNTYNGPTTISTGTLALAATGQIASSSSIANNATFVVMDGAHSVNAITGTGATFVASTGSLTAPSIVQNSLTIGGGPYAAGSAAVPEPGTLVLLLLAGAALAGAYLRRK